MTAFGISSFILFFVTVIVCIVYMAKLDVAKKSIEDKQGIINELVKQREDLYETIEHKNLDAQRLRRETHEAIIRARLGQEVIASVHHGLSMLIAPGLRNKKITVVASSKLMDMRQQIIESQAIIYGGFKNQDVWKRGPLPVSDMSDKIRALKEKLNA